MITDPYHCSTPEYSAVVPAGTVQYRYDMSCTIHVMLCLSICLSVYGVLPNLPPTPPSSHPIELGWTRLGCCLLASQVTDLFTAELLVPDAKTISWS
jgi:hypothetical protein